MAVTPMTTATTTGHSHTAKYAQLEVDPLDARNSSPAIVSSQAMANGPNC